MEVQARIVHVETPVILPRHDTTAVAATISEIYLLYPT
jgi:hypothetical protein